MNGYEVEPSPLDLPATGDLLRLFADPSRVRLLALLDLEELTVAELTRVTGLAQSRVSSHLARLKEAGLVVDRRDGSSTWYHLRAEGVPASTRSVWELVQTATRDPLLEQDRDQLREVLGSRDGAATWADSVAGQMDRHYSPGRTWEATAWGTLGLARLGDVLDVASGDGVLAELLAPRARAVTCLDLSDKVLDAGRRRLRHLDSVSFRRGDMHELPFAPASFDQVLLMNALTYARDPERVLAEAGRVLRPGGALVGVTLKRHRHAEAVARFDHVQMGFDVDELETALARAGFHVELCRVTSRERRRPCFEVITIHAYKPEPGRKARGKR